MEEILKSLSPDRLVLLTAGLIYIAKQFGEWAVKLVFKKSNQIDELIHAVKELSLKLDHFSARLISTEIKLDKQDEVKHLVWKLEHDVKFAHDKIRELKEEALRDDN